MTNGFCVKPSEDKAQLATLIAIPLVEVSAEDLRQSPSSIEKVDEKELSFVVRISARENDSARSGKNEKYERPEKVFGG